MYREHVILQQNYFKTYVVCTYKLSIFPSYIIIQHCLQQHISTTFIKS